ncbi:MAG: exodeoxyribonuclease III [Candidatus Thorarchaeota archaeon]
MKIISWNVNGIRAILKKGLLDFIEKENADVYCFQETKSSPEMGDIAPLVLTDFEQYWHHAAKKGYSGTAILTRVPPISVFKGIDRKGFDIEGRALTLEYYEFFLVNVYFPNSGRGLDRLDYKLEFNTRLLRYVQRLRKKKPVIITGDFNVSHKEIDLARPKGNRGHAGFTDDERNWFDRLLSKGYVDTFREFSDEGGQYTWWSYLHNARAKNVGWRLDYFVICEELKTRMVKSEILNDVLGSDHCPIRLELNSQNR